MGRTEGFRANYANNDRGKRSIAVNATTEDGPRIVLDLAVAPDIIHVPIDGLGLTSPYADRQHRFDSAPPPLDSAARS